MAVPTFGYDKSRIKLYNKDSTDDAEIKIKSYASGNDFSEEIDTDGTPVTKTLQAEEYGTININTPSQYVKIQGKGSVSIRAEFVGEA